MNPDRTPVPPGAPLPAQFRNAMEDNAEDLSEEHIIAFNKRYRDQMAEVAVQRTWSFEEQVMVETASGIKIHDHLVMEPQSSANKSVAGAQKHKRKSAAPHASAESQKRKLEVLQLAEDDPVEVFRVAPKAREGFCKVSRKEKDAEASFWKN